MKDFTLKIYRQLLQALQRANYDFYTFEDWCEGKASGRYVILRHDVDLKALNSLRTAQIEAELGIRASYYFRVVPQSNQPEIIRSIAQLGHEIGYHYEDLSLFKGDVGKSIEHFENQLSYFRQFYPVRTICMHGSPTSKWDNKDLWNKYNYRDYGIIGEPYFDMLNNGSVKDILYFTDTARMWDGDRFNVRDKVQLSDKQLVENDKRLVISDRRNNFFSSKCLKSNRPVHSTFDFINWLETAQPANSLMITTHPQRWTDNSVQWLQELVMQSLKNVVKRYYASRC